MGTEQGVEHREQGFTLIELMIVVAILAIVAAISVPNLISARMNANEAAAIATLKALSSAQAQFATTDAIDLNHNGAGEFGYFGELTGGTGLRDAAGASSDRLFPPLMSGNFAIVDTAPAMTGGGVIRAGYMFQIFLPDSSSEGIPEADSGGVGATSPDPIQAEILWCAYAWPLSFGTSGKRAFFVNQNGEVLSTQNLQQRYSLTRPPAYTAAFQKGAGNRMASTIAVATTGQDDQLWTTAN